MNNRQKLDQYRGNMNRRFNNMNGNQLANQPGVGRPRPAGWSANGSATAMSTAPQYILQISNASAADVQGFDIFGAAQYLMGGYNGATWSASGNLTKNGVTVSSVFGNVTYQQILTSSMTQVFQAGGVYLQAIAGNNNMVSQTYQIISTSAGGKSYNENIKPFIDPTQFQNGITYNNQSFNITSLTTLTWNTIFASSVFQITIFPANIVDPAQALNQGQVQTGYTSPKVIGTLS